MLVCSRLNSALVSTAGSLVSAYFGTMSHFALINTPSPSGHFLVDSSFLFFFYSVFVKKKLLTSNPRRLLYHRRRFPSNRYWVHSNRLWLPCPSSAIQLCV